MKLHKLCANKNFRYFLIRLNSKILQISKLLTLNFLFNRRVYPTQMCEHRHRTVSDASYMIMIEIGHFFLFIITAKVFHSWIESCNNPTRLYTWNIILVYTNRNFYNINTRNISIQIYSIVNKYWNLYQNIF